ncbi:MAG: D-alanyl-D-alanine carboxypeptidase [Wolbachia endosymbiont of Fragariocoptes setiger]|nr:D-alanyl-D-alanine carboxypeptidase [Wolbachia endosymbiont of Fragariocoptes setiger]
MLNRLCTLLLFFLFPFHLFSYQFRTIAKQAVILDLDSNFFIFEHNADEKMTPSSMSKLMTLYIAFHFLKAGIISMDDKFQVSTKAWKRKGSSMFLREGQQVKVRELIEGIIISSGNDACITLAEGIAGSEENFVNEMNEMAFNLNLNDSHFANSSGWPDENHFMSAKDLAVLSKRIYIDFPEYYELFSKKNLIFNEIEQRNKNLLLNHNIGVDGLKTGKTNVGGYGISISAKYENRRIFVVINGLNTEKERVEEARKLVQYGLNHFINKKVFSTGNVVEEVKVVYGKDKKVPITVENDVIITYNRSLEKKVKIWIEYVDVIPAPIKKGLEIGKMFIQIPDFKEKVIPLYAMHDVKALNPIEKFFRMLF